MTELTVGEQVIRFDRDATLLAYLGLRHGYADACPVGDSCEDCKNFAMQREVAFPDSFQALLEKLGIDLKKEDENCTYREAENGTQDYGGWYYLVGELVAGEPPRNWQTDYRGFHCHFSTSHPSRGDFTARPILALHFNVQLAWLMTNGAQ